VIGVLVVSCGGGIVFLPTLLLKKERHWIRMIRRIVIDGWYVGGERKLVVVVSLDERTDCH